MHYPRSAPTLMQPISPSLHQEAQGENVETNMGLSFEIFRNLPQSFQACARAFKLSGDKDATVVLNAKMVK